MIWMECETRWSFAAAGICNDRNPAWRVETARFASEARSVLISILAERCRCTDSVCKVCSADGPNGLRRYGAWQSRSLTSSDSKI